jgi:hypothetical protein
MRPRTIILLLIVVFIVSGLVGAVSEKLRNCFFSVDKSKSKLVFELLEYIYLRAKSAYHII